MTFLTRCFRVLLCILSGCFALWSQSSPAASSPASPTSSQARYPDNGYLSPTRYSNAYFGFSFELPPEAHLRPVPQRASSDGSVQLLELGGPPPADAQISIVAYTSGSRQGDPRALLRKALDQELYIGVEELRGLSRTTFAGHSFYLFETRRGIDEHMLLATALDGYVLQIFLAARDEKLLKQIELRFEHLQFFAPSELTQFVDADAKPYEGPAVSAHRLASLRADPPASHIALGEVDGSFYHNAALGFSYRFPDAWIVKKEGAVEPALVKSQNRDELLLDGSSRAGGGTEQQLMQLCSHTLFSAWAKQPGRDGLLTYDDFGEVTISAIVDGCFPGLAFPADANDREAFKSFVADLALTHPILRDMRDAKVIKSRGNVFLVLRGVLAMQIRNEELSRRVSIAMAVTPRRGYLLLMFFAAPHDSELEPLLENRVNFDLPSAAEHSTEVAETKGGGAETRSAVAGGPNAGAAETGKEAATLRDAAVASDGHTQADPASSSSQKPSPTTAANTASQPTATNSDTTAASDSSSASGQDSASTQRPTLLRPGETMQDQQIKGAPIPRH